MKCWKLSLKQKVQKNSERRKRGNDFDVREMSTCHRLTKKNQTPQLLESKKNKIQAKTKINYLSK